MNNLLLEPGLTLLVKSAEGLEGFRVLWCLLIPYLFAGELQESLENHLDHEQFLEAKENPYLYWRLSEELRICYPGPLAIRKARRF